jgi:hypothetical protein
MFPQIPIFLKSYPKVLVAKQQIGKKPLFLFGHLILFRAEIPL